MLVTNTLRRRSLNSVLVGYLSGSAFLVAVPALAQTSRVRDSAGVRIVENPSRLRAPVVFTLGAKPNFDIGGLNDDPDKELSTKNSYPIAIRLGNGNVMITDRTRVLLFDRSGKQLTVTGRSGGGPGEFGAISGLCSTRGDTVLVSDAGNSRISVLNSAGKFLGSFPQAGGTNPEGEFCLTDGAFFTSVSPRSVSETEIGLTLKRMTAAGASNTITDFTYKHDLAVRKPSVTTGWGVNIVRDDGSRHELRVYGPTGKLVRLVRTQDKIEPASKADIEKLPQMRTMGASPTQEQQKEASRRLAVVSHTKTWPTYDRVMVDLSGRLWMQDWRHSETDLLPQGWTAFDADGKLIGRLIIPAANTKDERQRVLRFGHNEVILRRFDSDGAIHYIAYPIVQKQ